MTPRLILFLVTTTMALAQERPGLFFREDWKDIPPVTPVTQEHVANGDLILSKMGPAAEQIRKSHHDKPADDPFYVWSGEAEKNWAISLRHRAAFVDLTGQAKIRWRAKQTGFRQLRIILKLADGKWIIGDQSDDEATDWRVREFNLPDLRWRTFDPIKISEGKWAPTPDLSKVDEIGVTDLMTGGGTPASSRLDWIEVYGKAVARGAATPAAAPRKS
ncbi:MAG TPA: hypothetical protein VM029_16975 [Opitutaceae bacterium]|nr:hypothetical protein [Opitutaceae bacterium]